MDPQITPKPDSKAIAPAANPAPLELAGVTGEMLAASWIKDPGLKSGQELFKRLAEFAEHGIQLSPAGLREAITTKMRTTLSLEQLLKFLDTSGSIESSCLTGHTKPKVFAALKSLVALRTECMLEIGNQVRAAERWPIDILSETQKRIENTHSPQAIFTQAGLSIDPALVPYTTEWTPLAQGVRTVVCLRRIAASLCHAQHPGEALEGENEPGVALACLNAFLSELSRKGFGAALERSTTEEAWAAWFYGKDKFASQAGQHHREDLVREVERSIRLINGAHYGADACSVRTSLQLLGVYGEPLASFSEQTNELVWERLRNNFGRLDQPDDLSLLVAVLKDKRPSAAVAMAAGLQLLHLLAYSKFSSQSLRETHGAFQILCQSYPAEAAQVGKAGLARCNSLLFRDRLSSWIVGPLAIFGLGKTK